MKSLTDSQNITTPAESHSTAAEFEAQLRSSMDDLLRKTRDHQDAWDLGEEDQWFLDEGSGELIFTFPDMVASAPAQIIGTHDSLSGLWTWAWAQDSVPDILKEDALRLKAYGQEHGFQHLLVPSWTAEETHCWYMTALACSLFEASGAYRGVTGNLCTFMIFREVVASPVAESDAEPVTNDEFFSTAVEEFKLFPEDPDQQRLACCRYLKRGTLTGVAQDELIHRLGLAAPSVLDLAGYAPEVAETVMSMLKSISDDEIMQADT